MTDYISVCFHNTISSTFLDHNVVYKNGNMATYKTSLPLAIRPPKHTTNLVGKILIPEIHETIKACNFIAPTQHLLLGVPCRSTLCT